MGQNPQDERAVFLAALEKNPEERVHFLDEVCGDNPGLFERVHRLLAAHDGSLGPLDKPEITLDFPQVTEKPGNCIGPYTIREQIGEGGMGIVFVAEQQQPISRKVAIKIIKPGMDTREVVARFEAERQALAMMDHPNIARVFEVGATEAGRPYFVMELVRGIPITDYCARRSLSLTSRLRLLQDVCFAVQHAHQKGVIHRDIKPSNVLVAEHDGSPVVKVIDFGVAKAINQKLTERTIYTKFQQMIGTPMYMSPEQAELSGLDVDTRSDVYSLGVLLYEMVTGTTPFDRESFQKAAYDEIRRIIREEEPDKPSTKVTTLRQTSSSTSAHDTSPDFGQSLKGDIDWIVMKSLDKDRARRYQSANDFAGDIGRFLSGLPIEARPPSRFYQARKFVRRNRAAVLASSAVITSLVVGLIGTGLALRRAVHESERAAQANALLVETNSKLEDRTKQVRQMDLHQAFAAASGADRRKTEQFLESAKLAGATDSELALAKARLESTCGNPRGAIRELQRAAKLAPQNLAVKSNLSVMYLDIGDFELAGQLAQECAALTPTSAEDYLFSGLAMMHFQADEAVERIEKSIAIFDSPFARTIYAQAIRQKALNSKDEALARKAFQEVSQVSLQLGSDHERVAQVTLACIHAVVVLSRANEATSEGLATLLSSADKCVANLSDSKNPAVLFHLASHYEYIRPDLKQARNTWEQSIQLGNGDLNRLLYASFLLRHDSLVSATEIIEPPMIKSSGALGLHLLLVALNPDTADEAAETWQEIGMKHPQARGMALLSALAIEDKQGLEQLGPVWIEQASNDEGLLFGFLQGLRTADELRAHNRLAEFWIGMKAFAVADYAMARTHLQEFAASGHYIDYWSPLAAGFVAELDRRASP